MPGGTRLFRWRARDNRSDPRRRARRGTSGGEVTHLRVGWHHDVSGDPVLLYSELDAARHEIRKVEVYRDGRGDRAGPGEATGSTRLGSEPVPESAEIAAQPEFTPEPISAEVFETAWRAAGMNALATQFTASFEERCGYRPDVNRVVLATAPAKGFSGELAVLYDVVREVSLPDVGNGYFIHAPEMVLLGIQGDSPTRLIGTVEDSIVVFGSDGGGGLFALSMSGRGVYRLADGSFFARGAPYDGGDVTVVAPDIGRFLDFLGAELAG
ncbi:DUF6881 domain-containing protein [Amycolatopsis tolypomycina]|uniref:DUF6881 domain-containing protein n=1 Tax=Amycolatopsis tolypomycina TaxID=208445 RepID=UPI000AF3C0E4|nr:hypothetical protein [Amycolatopsis tolypomycina]